jgi:hypothetical protein
MTAALLKRNDYSTMIGTQSNGTGCGYFNDTNWTDSTMMLDIKIPNSLFGVTPKAVPTNTILPFEENWDAANLENLPTVVDAANKVEWTVADIKGEKFSWFEKAITVLGYQKPVSTDGAKK